jgi:NTE family protein
VRAFVLGGGGARGALQVGALRALVEADIQPELLVGTSVGGLNATQLALRGATHEALDALEEAWRDAAERDLLPSSYLWLTVRTLFNRAGSGVEHQIRDFLVDHGLNPELRFGDLKGPRLLLLAADLRAGSPVLYGNNPDESVLEAVLASSAIPPWVRPLRQDGGMLMDGGVISNLPIEPAMAHGATEIVAFDLTELRGVGPASRGMGAFVFQLIYTVERRQTYMETQLAAARGVPVHHVKLLPESPMAVWDFPLAPSLFEPGYELMWRYLADHPELGVSAV